MFAETRPVASRLDASKDHRVSLKLAKRGIELQRSCIILMTRVAGDDAKRQQPDRFRLFGELMPVGKYAGLVFSYGPTVLLALFDIPFPQSHRLCHPSCTSSWHILAIPRRNGQVGPAVMTRRIGYQPSFLRFPTGPLPPDEANICAQLWSHAAF